MSWYFELAAVLGTLMFVYLIGYAMGKGQADRKEFMRGMREGRAGHSEAMLHRNRLIGEVRRLNERVVNQRREIKELKKRV